MEIGVKEVNFRENNTWLFKKDVSLFIKTGDVSLLFGPSASGKTTLFKMLSYIIPPHKGKVIWGNEEIINIKVANKKRSKYISLIPSHFIFFNHLNVKENLIFSASMVKKDKKIIEKKLEELVEVFNFNQEKELNKISLNFLLNKSIKSLSNGQKEIVAICRAFLLDTPFILADEMLRSFNEETEKVVWDVFYNLVKRYTKGVLVITHKEHLKHYHGVNKIYRIKERVLILENEN